MKFPKKWKTNTGAIIMLLYPAARAFVAIKWPEYVVVVDTLGASGAGLGMYGVADRAEKNGIAAPGAMVGRAVKKVEK